LNVAQKIKQGFETKVNMEEIEKKHLQLSFKQCQQDQPALVP